MPALGSPLLGIGHVPPGLNVDGIWKPEGVLSEVGFTPCRLN